MPKVQLGDIVVVIQAKVKSTHMLHSQQARKFTISAGSMP
jgi:hypothetical protein